MRRAAFALFATFALSVAALAACGSEPEPTWCPWPETDCLVQGLAPLGEDGGLRIEDAGRDGP